MTGNLRSGWTVDAAGVEITRCEQKAQLRRDEKQENARREEQREEQQSYARREAKKIYDRINNIRESKIWLLRFASAIAGMLLIALAISFRAKIVACLYNLFVGCLTLQLRYKRSRKRFLDKAIKAAEDRLG